MYDNPDDVRDIRLPVYVNKKESQLERKTASRLGMQPGQMRRDVLMAFYRRVESMTDDQLKKFINARVGHDANFIGLLH